MIELPAINLTGSNRLPHLFSRFLLIGFFLLVLLLLFAPWRQFVRGSGQVIAFDPLERRVNVESLVSGRVKQLNIVEGQKVKQGEVLAEIQDNDPDLLDNIKIKRSVVNERIALAKSRVDAMEAQIVQERLAKDRALDSAKQSVSAAEIARQTAQLNYKRVETLHEKGLVSRREYEQAVLKRDSTEASLRSSRATYEKTASEYDAKIASCLASLNSAKGDMAKAREDLTTLDIKVNQTQRQVVVAPRDGIVLSVGVTDGSYLKPGDPICVIIPETESRFVEIWVDGNDMPLIRPRVKDDSGFTPGSEVRLAFEGWPAIQLVGWPQLAQGTFAGEVVFVDATDDGYGRFRVVIGPANEAVDRGDGKGPVKTSWPSGDRWLRQGVKARAWVMLNEVPLWFELWRQINGFPSIGMGLEKDSTKVKKP